MPEAVASPAPAQASLPLPATPVAKPTGRFIIPDDPVATAPSTFQKPAESKPETPAQNTGAEATPTTPEGEQQEPQQQEEEDTPERAAKREGRRFERRISKAYREAAEAKARADFLERQLAERQQAAAQPQRIEGEPTLEQHNYDPEAYAKAKAEFAAKQAEKTFTQRQQQAAFQAQQQALVSQWESSVEKAEAKYDDFSEVVGELQPNTPLTAAIMSAENSADVAYYLGKNPALAQKLVQMPAIAQIREIGKLEAKLLSEPAKPKTPSKAPAPITPVQANAAPTSNQPSESDDMKTWMAKRNKQVRGIR